MKTMQMVSAADLEQVTGGYIYYDSQIGMWEVIHDKTSEVMGYFPVNSKKAVDYLNAKKSAINSCNYLKLRRNEIDSSQYTSLRVQCGKYE